MQTRIVLTVATAVLAGCGGGADGSTVAAFYPLAFAAERIAAPSTEVVDLTPRGAEPHDLELSSRDARRIADADVVLYLGDGFQPALERAIDSTDANAVDVLEAVDTIDGDPHVWLDPSRYADVALRIGEALDRPAAAEELAAELRALDAEFRRGLTGCARNTIVTSHAAFGYLAERYGLDQVAVTGIDPEAEATPGDLADTVERVRDTGATTVFFETLVSPRLAQTVARAVGADTAVLDPLESGPDEGDYFSAMRENLAALRQALGCR